MSSLALRRITKEVSNIKDKDYLEHSTYSKEIKNYLTSLTYNITKLDESDLSTNYLVIKENDKLFLELSIPQTYPFKPLKVVNYNKNKGRCYFNYINSISSKIINYDKNIYIFFYKCLYSCNPYFLMLKRDECYCCSSIMCSNLWCPAYTFVNNVLEHLEISFIEHYSSIIHYKELTTIYNTIFNRLPSEINAIILSYL